MSEKQGTNRRDFLKTCAIGTAVLGAGETLALAKAVQLRPVNSKVVIAKDAMLRGTGRRLIPRA